MGKRKATIVDCTLGAGGHSAALASRLQEPHIIGIDQDTLALTLARQRLSQINPPCTFETIQGNFGDIHGLLGQSRILQGGKKVDGFLLDLGVSSMQLDLPERGFSFRKDGPLDMRMNNSSSNELTASHIVNTYPIDLLGEILRVYGEEKNWRKIAERIASVRRQRTLTTTMDLVQAIGPVLDWKKKKGIHPATKTFQALRIAVNNEMQALSNFLSTAPSLLSSGGLLVVISFHSLEDRIVKKAFQENPNLYPMSSKPITPSQEELERNPRARSAKLRAAEFREA